MMQRWTTVALLAATLAGYVTSNAGEPAGANEVVQAQSEDSCGLIDPSEVNPEMPKIVDYYGQQLPKSEPDTIWVFTLPVDGYLQLARVAVLKKTVTNVYRVKQGTSVSDILSIVINDNYGQAVYPGHPNPPPPVTPMGYWYVQAKATYDARQRAADSWQLYQKTK